MARKRSEKVKAKYTVGSAFHALELPDADDLVVQADLVARIEAIMRDRGLTQVRAGALLGMDQPKVSALLRGGSIASRSSASSAPCATLARTCNSPSRRASSTTRAAA